MPRVPPAGHSHMAESIPPDTTLPSGVIATQETHLGAVGAGRCRFVHIHWVAGAGRGLHVGWLGGRGGRCGHVAWAVRAAGLRAFDAGEGIHDRGGLLSLAFCGLAARENFRARDPFSIVKGCVNLTGWQHGGQRDEGMDGWTDERTDGRKDRRTDERMDGWMDGMDGQTEEKKEEGMDGRTEVNWREVGMDGRTEDE
eukprot:354015-Chlamydomonas_euryale.AAC.3